MRLLGLGLTVALASTALPSAYLRAQSIINSRQAWGAAVNGLRMATSTSDDGSTPEQRPEFYVAIQNVGHEDVVLNLGSMLANGKVQFPQAVRLLLTDPTGHTRELEFFDRRYPVIAGRVDDFIVALRTGAVYGLRLDLEQYWSPATKEFAVKLNPGHHRIAAVFNGEGAHAVNLDMKGIALMHFWKGMLRSNTLEFEVSGNPR